MSPLSQAGLPRRRRTRMGGRASHAEAPHHGRHLSAEGCIGARRYTGIELDADSLGWTAAAELARNKRQGERAKP